MRFWKTLVSLPVALPLYGCMVTAFVACVIFFNYIASITRIGAGYVGVEVVLSGSQCGPAEIPIRTGWVFYSPLRSQIIEFPTFVRP
jgi:hypothetical protein